MRVTEKQLQAIVLRINELTKSPVETYTKTVDRFVANVGNYHLDLAYGGVALHRIMNAGGGITDIFQCGYVTKKELARLMWAYLDGLSLKIESEAI